MSKDAFVNFFADYFNYLITCVDFPDQLKHAYVISVRRKNEKCGKTCYRRVSVLTNISKINENSCITSCLNALINYFSQVYANFEKVPVRSAVSWLCWKSRKKQ